MIHTGRGQGVQMRREALSGVWDECGQIRM